MRDLLRVTTKYYAKMTSTIALYFQSCFYNPHDRLLRNRRLGQRQRSDVFLIARIEFKTWQKEDIAQQTNKSHATIT